MNYLEETTDDDLQKQNNDLMAQLQLGLDELKTTVQNYTDQTKKDNPVSSLKQRNQSNKFKNGLNLKERNEVIKLRRSSRNTSTPKANKSMAIENQTNNVVSSLILDNGNLRPDKNILSYKSKITPIRSNRKRNTILQEKNVANISKKSPKDQSHCHKSIKPQKSRKTEQKLGYKSPCKSRSSNYLKTPKYTGNLKPDRNSNLKQSFQKLPKKSILQSSKHDKIPSRGNRVYFSSAIDTNHISCDNDETTVDTTLMGYDWIAGMLDNETSINDRSDNFFNEMREFRKDNWNDCKGIKCSDSNTSTNEINFPLSPPLKHTNEEIYPLCCKGNGAYMVNNRLDLIPIHGPYSACPSCKLKPISQCDENGVVRVSIPHAIVKSPYKLRPHRRKSFDPSDSVALSMHCLAGWQASKPAYIPGPTNVDLASHIAKPGLTSVKAVKDKRLRR